MQFPCLVSQDFFFANLLLNFSDKTAAQQQNFFVKWFIQKPI